jgi:Asp-tRNA(Asn)/Glu-tRNA(Gln) amidotransferase A subunit family amidase
MAHSMSDIHLMFDTMQGYDHNDSNCVDFSKIHKIRYRDRVLDNSLEAPGLLEGLRVGVLDEFAIEELDDRNRAI